MDLEIRVDLEVGRSKDLWVDLEMDGSRDKGRSRGGSI